MKVRLCELCNAKAAVFCPSDAAFLCWTCDSKVHEANFLVARHVRRALCSNCNSYTADFVSSRPSACPSCPPASPADDDLGSLSSTSSSACASSTTSPAAKLCSGDSSSTVTLAKRRRTTSKPRLNQLKAEGVFAGWCGKLGIETGAVARAASRALKVCADRWTAVPFRVCLAASMWLGLRLSLEKSELTWRILKRLEEISGVPPKIILASVSKLERVVRGGELDPRRRLELEEGWAEC